MASPILQEIFGASAAVARGFTGLISLFNIGGRFFWASLSARIGRKATYTVLHPRHRALHGSRTRRANRQPAATFVIAICVIVSMYAAGSQRSRVPRRYLRHAVRGRHPRRLLTPGRPPGIIGPVIVNYIREYHVKSACRGRVRTTSRLHPRRNARVRTDREQRARQTAFRSMVHDNEDLAALQARGGRGSTPINPRPSGSVRVGLERTDTLAWTPLAYRSPGVSGSPSPRLSSSLRIGSNV